MEIFCNYFFATISLWHVPFSIGEMMKITEINAQSFGSFFKNILNPFRWHIVGQIITIAIYALDISLRPYALKLIIDKLSFNHTNSFNSSSLTVPIFLYLGMFLFVNISYRLYDYFVYRRNPEIKKSIIRKLLGNITEFSSDFFQNHMPGSLAGKINDVANGIPQILTIAIDRFLGNALILLFAIFTTWQVGKIFSLFLIGWVFVIVFVMSIFVKKAKSLSIKTSEAWTDVLGQMVDVLSNISSVRLFVNQKLERKITDENLDNAILSEKQYFSFAIKIYSSIGLAFVVFQAICIYLLILGIKTGMISAGDFSLILTLNISISDQLFMLTQDIAQFLEHLGKVLHGYTIISTSQEILDKPNAKELVVKKGEIIFENITFKYKNTSLQFFNEKVVINAGEKIGLVGYSGSGKSTFVNLILRLFEVQSGKILIDGQNISEVTQESLRKSIAIVPQDIPLFHRTLIENIRYGRNDATDEEVVAAAKTAHAHDFIMNLPNTYQMMVGDRGSKLSGGQRQRIAIARAALKNAPILIFDEATSALDSITENLIQDSLWDLMQGRTTIVIAHKLSTLQWMDRILVFDQGKIIEEGTHAQLLEKAGLYNLMWEAQIGNFLQKQESLEELNIGEKEKPIEEFTNALEHLNANISTNDDLDGKKF